MRIVSTDHKVIGLQYLVTSLAFLLLGFLLILLIRWQLAFPGAVGWAKTTVGGRGGRIIRVTNLEADGPGSFKAALEAKGPRIVVFEVGGVIDMKRKELNIREPHLTIAGQTAPSPCITLIKTGLNIRASQVIVRHIRVRTGADGDHAGRVDDAGARRGGGEDVARALGVDGVHPVQGRTPHGDDPGRVKDDRAAGDGAADGVRVAHVAVDRLHRQR